MIRLLAFHDTPPYKEICELLTVAMAPRFENLPRALMQHVASFLDARAEGSLKSTCRAWRKLLPTSVLSCAHAVIIGPMLPSNYRDHMNWLELATKLV